ncbi:MAG: proton-conducting transporter transmembrane domain-containing protein, partial [Ginsengibacter sp.]
INELSGLAGKAPTLAIFLLVIALANIALPLTDSFISEFLMLNGIFDFNKWYGFFATIGVILSAVYMLSMIQKTFFGKTNDIAERSGKLTAGQYVALSVLVAGILFLGIYPEPVIHLTQSTVTNILGRIPIK